MLSTTDDLRISELKELSTPQEVMREIPRTLTATRIVMAARNAIHAILHGTDDRLLVVVGPCSIHDPVAAVEYAARLAALREQLADRLEIVMRVYFEKPRTTVGWKGLINDPDLDGSFRHQQGTAAGAQRAVGRQQSRPAGRHRIPRHDDAAIHRRPDRVGGDRRAHDREPDPSRTGVRAFLPGRLQERHRRQCPHRADAVKSASHPHHFLAVTKGGHSAIAATTGNEDCHIILRGGNRRTTTAPASRPPAANWAAPAWRRG